MHRLRPATLDDLEFLVKIDLDDEGVTPGYREEWGETEAAEHRAKIRSFVTDDDKGARVAETEEDRQAGAILWRYRDASKEDFVVENVFREIRSVFPPDGRFCEVFQLWVDPAHRRQGIATALKQAAEADAVARGVGLIYTHTEERNDHVVALNAKLGYYEVRRGPIWDDVVRISLVKRL